MGRRFRRALPDPPCVYLFCCRSTLERDERKDVRHAGIHLNDQFDPLRLEMGTPR
jgi:hypothetical protein